jgi:hypothetical protein
MMDINTTPLIDVMLVLLVMLIITIPIQLHSVNLNLPTGNPPPPIVKPEVLKIDIDASGVIYFNGEVVPDRADVEARLKACRRAGRATGAAFAPGQVGQVRYRRHGDGVGAATRADQDRHRRQRTVRRVAKRARALQAESRAMDYARQQRDPTKHAIGIVFVVAMHTLLLIWALLDWASGAPSSR